ncbi:MAG: hypothetical protein RR782_02875 [Clostridium sp.]
MVKEWEENKVYRDFADRLYFAEHGYLHTSLGFRYKALSDANKEDYNLTRLTKEQLLERWKPCGRLIRKKRNRNR